MGMDREKSAQSDTLCVDLDGTLLRTDLLHETFIQLLKRKPHFLGLVPFWLLQGRAQLKRKIAEQTDIDPAILPYNEEVVNFLKDEHQRGRRLVLASAADKILADKVAEHLGFFDEVLASDEGLNLKGRNKQAALTEKYGEGSYSYIGDSKSDVHIWNSASEAYVVTSGKSFVKKVNKDNKVVDSFSSGKSFAAIFKALRVHQWVKNLLLFVPILMAHKVADPQLLWQVVLGFFSFCFVASGVYVLNDLLDLEADRQHVKKQHRPFASGSLPLYWGGILIPLLLVAGALLALALPTNFMFLLAGYFILTTLYSFQLKRIVLIDIFTLAMLYTLRVLAGGFAATVPVSEWLLAFSMFMFLSLACVKRYSELLPLKESTDMAAGRGYQAGDISQIGRFGTISGYLAVLVLALYISSDDVTALYRHPAILWLLCPVILYWISRVWLLTHRGQMHEDPIVFALHDYTSYLVGAISAALLLAGS